MNEPISDHPNAPAYLAKIYPSLLKRIQSVAIDTVLIFFVAYLIFSLLDSYSFAALNLKAVFFILIFVLYEPLMVTFTGGTLGHKVMEITVRQELNHNEHILLASAFLRFFAKVLLGTLSLLTVTLNDEKRAIHDMVSGSVVINVVKEAKAS